MQRLTIWITTILSGLAVALCLVAAPASADSDRPVLRVEQQMVAEGTAKLAPRWAKCNVKAESPHWSKGAKSVIFKTRVKCWGKGIPYVSVYVTGRLGHVGGGKPGKCAAGPPVTVARSKESQTIRVNGGPKTYYTPQVKGKKVKLSGTYSGSVTARITAPLKSGLGSTNSPCNYVKAP